MANELSKLSKLAENHHLTDELSKDGWQIYLPRNAEICVDKTGLLRVNEGEERRARSCID